jgi:hypothetical protein
MSQKVTPAQARRLSRLIRDCAALIDTATNVLDHGFDATGLLGAADFREIYRGELEQRMAGVRASMIQICEAGDTDKAAIHSRADKILRVRGAQPQEAPK